MSWLVESNAPVFCATLRPNTFGLAGARIGTFERLGRLLAEDGRAVVFAMNRAREKHNFELMLELALGLDENAMRDLLRVMMKKYAVNHPSASALFSTTPQPTSQSFLALLPAGEPAASPTRSSMRALLNVVLKSDPDVDAFCLDYFPSVQKRICVGMDRQTKYNKLLEEANTREILEHLVAAYPERVAAQQSLLLWEPPRT